MSSFTALSYDQVIQKIKRHKPDVEPSIYLYQCLELDTIAPIFFFKSRVKRQTLTKNGIEWRYANFCGWAASYDRKLNDFFRVGYQPSANDILTVSFDRLFLVHAERRFDWETPQIPDEELEVKLYPPLPWHLAESSEKFSISRTNICFWVTDASELNQIDATRTDTATVNKDDQTARCEQLITPSKKVDSRELTNYHRLINILLYECRIDVSLPHQAAELLDQIATTNGLPSMDRKTFVKIIERAQLTRIKSK